MENKIIEITQNNNELYIYWVLTDFCNQTCSYCPKNLHSGLFHSIGLVKNDTIDQFMARVINIVETKNIKLCIDIAGGEPTIVEYLPTIIAKLKPYGKINLITNGTRSLSWWENLSVLPSGVIITLHPEYYDKKKLRINDLAHFLVDNHVSVSFNLMCQPDRWETTMSIFEDLDNQFKKLVIPKVINNQDVYDRPIAGYTQEHLDFINSHTNEVPPDSTVTYDDYSVNNLNANRIMSKNQHQFKGWSCAAGVNAICVKENGNVYAGICNSKNLGTMSNFKLLDEYITCPRPSCTCPGDIKLSKYNPMVRRTGIEPIFTV